MKSFSARFVLPIILAAGVAGCGSSASSSSSTPTPATTPLPTVQVLATPVVAGGAVAAIVNGNKLPMSTFRVLLELAIRQSKGQAGVTTKSLAGQVLTEIIDDEVVREYAGAHGLAATNAEVTARLLTDEKSFGGEAGLKKQLVQVGLSFADYKILVRTAVQRHKVAHVVTPLHASTVRHILIATTQHKPPRTDASARALATQILAQIQHGGNFATLAKKYSDDPGSGKLGGNLGSFCTGLGLMVPTFDQASATLPVNHPAIVHSQFGYHIVEVLSRGLARPGQCVSPSATPGTAPYQDEQTLAFHTWVTTQVKTARVQRIARVA